MITTVLANSKNNARYRYLGCFRLVLAVSFFSAMYTVIRLVDRTSRDADMGNGERVIATLEHSDERLDGGYRGRVDAIGKCARGTGGEKEGERGAKLGTGREGGRKGGRQGGRGRKERMEGNGRGE